MMGSTETICCFFLFVGYAAAQGNIIDIMRHGAKPDGDITQAVMAAWTEGCACTAPSTILIPKGNFIMCNVELTGPCKSPITLRVEGIVKATPDPATMKPDAEWVCIRNIEGFTLNGGGTFDGQGAIKAWPAKTECQKSKTCPKFPNNLSFGFLTNALIEGITSVDSKLFHANVYGCKNITVQNFKTCAPAESPNTDGIHISRSAGVTVIDSEFKTGDDCVSIGDGVTQLRVEKVTCGPGHGISIGSLGKYPKEEPVCGILIKNCTLTGTDNGVRIKTWAAMEACSVTDVKFEDIIMNNVENPILIDQEYCNTGKSGSCKNDPPSKVPISNVCYKNIKGTSISKETIKFICSGSHPCAGVQLTDVNLAHTGADGPAISVCRNIKPAVVGEVIPCACGAAAAAPGTAATAAPGVAATAAPGALGAAAADATAAAKPEKEAGAAKPEKEAGAAKPEKEAEAKAKAKPEKEKEL